MKERRIRRKFDQEFKMEAVRLVTEGGETVASVAILGNYIILNK